MKNRLLSLTLATALASCTSAEKKSELIDKINVEVYRRVYKIMQEIEMDLMLETLRQRGVFPEPLLLPETITSTIPLDQITPPIPPIPSLPPRRKEEEIRKEIRKNIWWPFHWPVLRKMHDTRYSPKKLV